MTIIEDIVDSIIPPGDDGKGYGINFLGYTVAVVFAGFLWFLLFTWYAFYRNVLFGTWLCPESRLHTFLVALIGTILAGIFIGLIVWNYKNPDCS